MRRLVPRGPNSYMDQRVTGSDGYGYLSCCPGWEGCHGWTGRCVAVLEPSSMTVPAQAPEPDTRAEVVRAGPHESWMAYQWHPGRRPARRSPQRTAERGLATNAIERLLRFRCSPRTLRVGLTRGRLTDTSASGLQAYRPTERATDQARNTSLEAQRP